MIIDCLSSAKGMVGIECQKPDMPFPAVLNQKFLSVFSMALRPESENAENLI